MFCSDTKTAAGRQHLLCLQRLHLSGKPWNKYTTGIAAAKGDLRCLQFAHEHGCSWDDDTTYQAACCGSLDCLKYALDHSCPVDMEMAYGAAIHGNSRCLKYIFENYVHLVPWDQSYLCDFEEDTNIPQYIVHYLRKVELKWKATTPVYLKPAKA